MYSEFILNSSTDRDQDQEKIITIFLLNLDLYLDLFFISNKLIFVYVSDNNLIHQKTNQYFPSLTSK
jgi:hypothetical protein